MLAFSVNANTTEDDASVENLDEMAVEGDVYPQSTIKLMPESSSILQNTADVLKKMPGAYVNSNGVLSGIAQYRGLFGSRVNVNADGTQVVESCSNSMDASMSHVPASMVDAVELQRGISSISQGIETLGGSINVLGKSLTGQAEGFSGDVNIAYATGNEGRVGSVNLQNINGQHGVQIGLDVERSENQTFSGGENVFTGSERNYYMAAYQFENDNTLFSLSTNYNDTGETGTPALPMDITYAQGGISTVDLVFDLNDAWQLSGNAAYQYTKHLMDNYRHRDQVMANYRESLTRVERKALTLKAQKSTRDSGFEFGIDIDDVTNTADISNPNNLQFNITNFDVSKERFSVFGEYQQQVNEKHHYMFGLRWAQTEADAGEVSSSVAMMDSAMGQMHRTLRDRFNSADRSKTDDNIDVMFNWQQTINNDLSFEYGIGIKNRAPSHQERYLWLPVEASAGLADGKQYLGNLDLDSEQALQLELAMNYANERFSMTPHVFYHRINDYIQGVPNTVMPAPEGVLRYDNVDAELYGIDFEWELQISDSWHLKNVTSFVRGKRRDIEDNLYRIAPANTWLNLSYETGQWQLDTEIMAATKQDKVSLTNDEKATPGYGVLHFSVIRTINDNSHVKLAINNVFDKLYYQHTNGYNRNNRNVDVGFDANNLQAYRLPSEGRSFNIRYSYAW